MQITLQTANVISDAKNCFYPNKIVATNALEMKEAIKKDHVCAAFIDDRRSNSNFLKSSVLVMDCDNDHSENPADWITPEKLEEMFPDVSYAVAFSRNHMKEKNGKPARPKFHVYFEIGECCDPAKYAGLKQAIWAKYPFFDDNALDAARFIFGADVGDVIWHEGWVCIDDMVLLQPETASTGKPEPPVKESDFSDYAIPIGSRNSSMSLFAARVLKRFGDSEKSYGEFLKQAARCNPPLEDAELDSIWKSALSFYNKKIVTSEGYLPPEKFDEEHFRASLEPEDYSDIGEARVLAREYQDELKYSDATRFLRYDGTRWLENEQYAVAAILEFLDLQLADAQEKIAIAEQALIKAKVPEDIVHKGSGAVHKYLRDEDNPLLKALIHAETYKQFAVSRRDYRRITATANTAKPMVLIDVCDLDKDEYLLNTPEATYDIQKGLSGKQSHNPSDLITKVTACTPGEEGKKVWLDTLDLIFCGNQELTDYVQQVVGLAAIGRVLHEHMIIAYGDGANGKSTFWNTIARVMGDYSGKLSAEALTTKCVRNVKPEMAELKGRRLIISSELEEGMRLNTSVVKQLCSTDMIIGEKKYKAPLNYTPENGHGFWLGRHHIPISWTVNLR